MIIINRCDAMIVCCVPLAGSYIGAVSFGATVFPQGPEPFLFKCPPESYQGAPQFLNSHWPPAVFLTVPMHTIFYGGNF